MQTLLAAGGAFLLRGARAQEDRTLGVSGRALPTSPDAHAGTSLLAAKRRALVLGNASYGFSPLKNPLNDANAIAQALRATGFQVSSALDLPRAQMETAIREYVAGLAREQSIGLFYFAGHGVQLAWRNYLLPTDAKVERMEDIQRSCVDVNSLIEGIAKAGNPMNVVILDACRENPFGADFRVEQKGLSQLDAPPGTLLAYATSPGNVASDGEGEHGLYTENLLREMRVPEAQIEDVFKRVRLAVRRRSRGRQIPWESTSLEQDFWFIPPKELRRLAEEEQEREFARQQALWEKAEAAGQLAAVEEYLRLHPNGHFAELAQVELDRLLALEGEKKIEVVSSQQNPYSQGFARADTNYQVGDRYEYRVIDLTGRHPPRTVNPRITRITDTEVIYGNGMLVTDRLGNVRRAGMRRFSPNQINPAEFLVGKRWTTRYSVTLGAQPERAAEMQLRIAARERITVPAGTFDCFRVEARASASGATGAHLADLKFWYAPERVRRFIVREEVRVTGGGDPRRPPGRPISSERMELVSYEQS